MTEIIPAILDQEFEEIEVKLTTIAGTVERVQIDICDGNYTENTTWPYITPPDRDKSFNYDYTFVEMVGGEREMPFWEGFLFDLDLMVSDPIHLLPDLLSMGPARVIIHFESLKDPQTELPQIEALLPSLVSLGLAINTTTDIDAIKPYIDEGMISFVQCMGIEHPGKQGEPFDARVLTQLEKLHDLYPDLPLMVDGAMNEVTAPQVVASGATSVVSGSYVWETDSPVHAVKTLSDTIDA